ncbi:hypothetical protein [Subtercola lobariae]|uniref:Uncharacterized protein n=1 Tax=Subtercola lobariae TaxID=1588641 RepID=A0A917BA28_9MICO|nr:hypothetical protein [Subtercola lobariae]GGF32836.1 hypothetical protein GCM10011399_27470 [Subtercola lobariae]
MDARRQIVETYTRLAANATAQPTLHDVAEAAGVTLESIRAEFQSPDEVVLLGLEEMLWMIRGSNMPRRLDEGIRPTSAARAICDDILGQVDSNRTIALVAVRFHRLITMDAIGSAIHHRCAAYFAAAPDFRKMDQAFLGTANVYVAQGLAGVVVSWVAGEISPDQSEVAAHMAELLPSWLSDPRTIADARRSGEEGS